VSKIAGSVFAVAASLAVVAIALWWGQMRAMEGHLKAAADELRDVARVTQFFREGMRTNDLEEPAAVVGGLLGRSVQRETQAIRLGIFEILEARVGPAVASLLEAEAAAGTAGVPTDGPRREAIGLVMAAGGAERGEVLALELVDLWPGRASSWMALGRTLEAQGRIRVAAAAFERAAEVGPFAVSPAEAAALAWGAAGDAEAAARWAAAALERDALRRLDPLVQMGEGRRAAMRALAAEQD
jgi:tetratricopeptide (TPR) repeat protein